MKNVLLVLVLLMGATTFAQNKNAKAVITVDGVCMMCKDRIEKASIKTKGVKSAVWNIDTKELRVIYNEEKTTLAAINASVASVGHDTEQIKATEEAYATVHPCCKYRDENLKEDHNKDN
jgi:mercuric ion binding protein